MRHVLGVDAGGTKTVAAVATEDGRVCGIGHAGCANFQACGTAGAAGQIDLAVRQAARQAGLEPQAFAAVCYGISGADRPRDFERVRDFTRPIAPCPVYRLENDTLIALRAGTPDGVGIALIAGTGSNAIGRNKAGQTLGVGGLGHLSGDYGSAGQLGQAAVVAAMMGRDGRGPETLLDQLICRHLDLATIVDIIEYEYYDSDLPALDLGTLAPLVFEAASAEDNVAITILDDAGKRIACAVKVILKRLFGDHPDVNIVFGGSIFQQGAHPALIDTITRECLPDHPGLKFTKLDVPPVVGAIEFAFDDCGWPVTSKIHVRLRERKYE
ncbi:MAG TPA: BadF/BadG/BcrA/BcrD ATPase family protein [Myxococcota bacterium]|nr:BadF/BadG/BcrA/BcrD ATPase family protein [Myxococcota bacterium]